MTIASTIRARTGGVGAWLLLLAGLAFAQTPPPNFVLNKAAKPVAAIMFQDEAGNARSLAEFRGKVVLLNIWATWCGPCRREMPSLDRLQAKLGGSEFQVVALSIDRSGVEVIRKFYADNAIRELAIFNDKSARAGRDLAALGVPATLLLDRDGREIGRLAGPAEWDAPATIEFLRHFVEQKSGRTGGRVRFAHGENR